MNRGRLLYRVLEADPIGAEFAVGFTALAWGLCLAWPGNSLMETRAAVYMLANGSWVLRHVGRPDDVDAVELAWTCLFVGWGVLQLAASILEHTIMRRVMALVGVGLWGYMFWTFVLTAGHRPGTYPYLVLALLSAWSSWRVGGAHEPRPF